MLHRFSLLLFFLIGTLPAFAQTADSTLNFNGSDIIALSDGSILVGKVKERTNNSIRFADKTIGETIFRKTDVRWEMHVEEGAAYRITTKSGSNYVGKLISANSKAIIIETSLTGQVAIPYESIQDVQRNGKITKGKQPDLPASADADYVLYHTLPSAIPLTRDFLYYRNMELFINSVGYGVSDNITIGGGVVGFVFPFIRVNGGWELSPGNYIGGGIVASAGFFGLGFGGVGGFATYTHGNAERHISASLGYGSFFSDGFAEAPEAPVINVSGLMKIGRRAVLVSENWIVPRIPSRIYNSTGTYTTVYDTYSAHSLIMRIIGQNRTWEFGLMTSPQFFNQNDFNLFFIPYVGYMFRF